MMPTLFFVLTSVLSTATAAFHEYEYNCNTTALPWSVSREDHPVLSENGLERLLQCPKDLHGCSSDITPCEEERYIVTCSCASNCQDYGDCCWQAGPSLERHSSSSCIRLNVEGKYERDLYMVTGCNPTWPMDDTRESCEAIDSFQDTFYVIPVTSARNVTYRNAFCALCNYDLDNATTFWNATSKIRRYFKVTTPDMADENKPLHLRPCAFHTRINDSCLEGSDSETVRRCHTYFAPVKPKGNESEVIYKNIYCGLCNGADPLELECAPMLVVPETWFLPQLRSGRPNLLSLLRPVLTSDSCFSWHSNKCYIRAPQYRYNASVTGANASLVNGTNATASEQQPYDIQNYLTVVCVSLSLLCLLLKGLVYILYKSSRTFSSRCTLCLSATLFWSQLIFLLVNSLEVPHSVCTGSAIVLHYGFLSTFFWTSVLSFDIWKNVAGVRLTSGRSSGFIAYCLIAWGGPLAIVAICVLLNWTAPTFVLSPRYARRGCWIGSFWGQVTFFLFPMFALLILDIGLYVHIVYHIRKTVKQAANFDFRGGAQRSHMALFIKLGFIIGTTWLLGFVGVFVNNVAMDIIVIIFVGLQGVYLFFGFRDYTYFLPKRPFRKDLARTTSASSANTDVPTIERHPNGSLREGVQRGPAFNTFEKLE
ncbi:hypothetical protein ISCGN_032918 [Ixodes scapularis]|uniref:G-protein coupled receptors family 2 profile 2 domain-containing protein n=1 Tax=Ixodes scapularis TaxID=6945 RepID=B7QM22_IXOSC|nr:hypothetical protein IscW_ISCW023670 [Ixodes scapularis]|eukprot:XP_002416227.1 hypothetical protein IscW_ISCW023670 [Ixodes scapularis]